MYAIAALFLSFASLLTSVAVICWLANSPYYGRGILARRRFRRDLVQAAAVVLGFSTLLTVLIFFLLAYHGHLKEIHMLLGWNPLV